MEEEGGHQLAEDGGKGHTHQVDGIASAVGRTFPFPPDPELNPSAKLQFFFRCR